MRRYIFCGETDKLEKHYFDVVIIGSGIAGLYTALNLDEKLSCAILSKGDMEKGSSWLAQGGVASVTHVDDKIEYHVKDTLTAGAGICNKNAVKILAQEGPMDIKNLLSLNVPFDVDEDGNLLITKEGGHSKNRILHSSGDGTGREITKKLTEIVNERKNISLIENTFLVDLLTVDNHAAGVIVYDGEYRIYSASNIVISTGGIGQVYKQTTNQKGATGDGIAAAIRAGIKVKDMEFVQFHPTALYEPNKRGQYFLISEAVRGEGGILRNYKGERFMAGVHPMAELAPRDIVSRAITYEIQKNNYENVFLDVTDIDKEYFARRFPTIYNECKSRGIDISKQWIPVCPVQHYFMGGIVTDLNGATNIQGIYACGEAACTGVHGANRLASNSLLECLVFGRRAAQFISSTDRKQDSICFKTDLTENDIIINTDEIRAMIQKIMSENAGIIRNTEGMLKALKRLNSYEELFENTDLDSPNKIELYNLIIVAKNIVESAIKRKESVGAHFLKNEQYKGAIKAC